MLYLGLICVTVRSPLKSLVEPSIVICWHPFWLISISENKVLLVSPEVSSQIPFHFPEKSRQPSAVWVWLGIKLGIKSFSFFIGGKLSASDEVKIKALTAKNFFIWSSPNSMLVL